MSSMASNEDLLREIEQLKAENAALRSQIPQIVKAMREPYSQAKLTRIPEFENVFWQRSESGSVYLINRQWLSALGSIIRALLFPQYTDLSYQRNKYARCTDLNDDEYRKYNELMDYVLGYLAAQAYTQRVKEDNT